MKKYHFHNTVSLKDGCRLLNTNPPRMKRLASKGCFDLLDVGSRFRRIPTIEMLDYCQIILEENKKLQHHIESSISELRTKMILSQANEKLDDDLKEEFRELFQEFAEQEV